MVRIKGHDIQIVPLRDSLDRRALLLQNTIMKTLLKLGISKDDIDVPLSSGIKKTPASVTWYLDKRHLHYSYGGAGKFVENLAVVAKVLEIEVRLLLEEKKTFEEFIAEFHEEPDILDRRKEAREALGLTSDVVNMETIDRAYKNLAKKHHPDKDTGNAEQFKKINHAHKVLKRELT